jgi:hypothetical protein
MAFGSPNRAGDIRSTMVEAATSVTVSPAPSVSGQPLPLVMDEHFAGTALGWPNNPLSTAWLADGGYHLAARQADQFVALGAPLVQRLWDVVVTATFRKVGGPPGRRLWLDRRSGARSAQWS